MIGVKTPRVVFDKLQEHFSLLRQTVIDCNFVFLSFRRNPQRCLPNTSWLKYPNKCKNTSANVASLPCRQKALLHPPWELFDTHLIVPFSAVSFSLLRCNYQLPRTPKSNSDRKSRAIKFHIKKTTATTLRPKKVKISKPTQKNYLIIST